MRWSLPISIHIYFSAMYVHVCVGGGHVGAPSDTPTPTHTYTCKCWGPQITKNAIKLEQIEIIQFCLKIWNLCTFLHLYRLGLVCRWEGVPSQIAFFTFRPKTYISFAPVSLWVKVLLFLQWSLIDHI